MSEGQRIQIRQFATTTTYANIFGQPGPQIQIIGTQAALGALQKTIAIDGRVVRPDKPAHPGEAVEQSLEFLRLKDAFPTNEDLLRFAAQPPESQRVNGIDRGDWIVTRTVKNTVWPPFSFTDLNVDFLLAFLRIAQTYHSQNRIYQLLILTRTNREQYHVDLLPSIPDSRGTHSIFFYRSFGHAVDGAVVENWRGSSLRPQAQMPNPEIVAPPSLSPALLERIARLRERRIGKLAKRYATEPHDTDNEARLQE